MTINACKKDDNSLSVVYFNCTGLCYESYRKVQANEFLEIGDKYQETDRLFTKWDGRPMNL